MSSPVVGKIEQLNDKPAPFEEIFLRRAHEEVYRKLERYRLALEKLANPEVLADTEEGALIQMEVAKIAEEALAP